MAGVWSASWPVCSSAFSALRPRRNEVLQRLGELDPHTLRDRELHRLPDGVERLIQLVDQPLEGRLAGAGTVAKDRPALLAADQMNQMGPQALHLVRCLAAATAGTPRAAIPQN
jgi:hypothetical protein